MQAMGCVNGGPSRHAHCLGALDELKIEPPAQQQRWAAHEMFLRSWPQRGGLAHQSQHYCMASRASGTWHLKGQQGSPQQHAQGHCGFQHGKLVPDTLPRSTTKGDERKIAGNLIWV